MKTVLAKKITLHDLKKHFGLSRVDDEQFFHEWLTDLPEITETDKTVSDRIRAGYLNLVENPPMLEDSVKMAILGPLLNLAGFYLPPFYIRPEASVRFSDADEEIVVEGKIDVLVLRDQFWVMVIEAKQAAFSVEAGLARILAYMMGNPESEHPCFGLIVTGGSFVFIKLIRNTMPRYATSRVFELRNPGNDLHTVLRILKRIGKTVCEERMVRPGDQGDRTN